MYRDLPPILKQEMYLHQFFLAICTVIPAVMICVGIYHFMQSSSESAFPLILTGVVAIGVMMFFAKMTVLVYNDAIIVTLGFIPLIKRVIPKSNIENAEVVTFRPLRDFGGWGIRISKFRGEYTGCYSLRGTEGVMLNLSTKVRVVFFKVRKIVIGSHDPERLLGAINS